MYAKRGAQWDEQSWPELSVSGGSFPPESLLGALPPFLAGRKTGCLSKM